MKSIMAAGLVVETLVRGKGSACVPEANPGPRLGAGTGTRRFSGCL